MKYSDNNLNILINIMSSDKILRNKINIACYIKIYKNDYKRYIITITIIIKNNFIFDKKNFAQIP